MKRNLFMPAAWCLLANSAWSQDKPTGFPDKQVRIILLFARGGSPLKVLT